MMMMIIMTMTMMTMTIMLLMTLLFGVQWLRHIGWQEEEGGAHELLQLPARRGRELLLQLLWSWRAALPRPLPVELPRSWPAVDGGFK